MQKLILALTLSSALVSCQGEKSKYVTIGTGGVTGVYYPVGGAIAKLVNANSKSNKIKASVESTAGSVYNINAVLTGDLEFGVAQSDRQYQALNNQKEWSTGKSETSKLRAVFSLHREAITFLAKAQGPISNVKDLKGKSDLVINIGSMGSGERGNSLDVLGAAGINIDSDFKAESIKSSESSKMLQDGRLDGFIFTVGHPSGAITEATNGKIKVRFVPIEGADSLLKKYPYYTKAVIPAEFYPQAASKEDTPTIGVVATLVTSSDVSDEVVYNLTKEVFENFDQFKKIHPALSHLTKASMLEGLSAPLHSGAKKYFTEVGLLKK